MLNRNNKYYQFFLLTLSSLIVNCSLLIAQESEEEFQIGAYFNKQTRTNPAYYKRLEEIGMNLIMQNASDATKPFVKDYNLLADNSDGKTDYVMHYSTAWYSKWEAEEDQKEWDKVGVKHKCGSVAKYKGVQCWSSKGATSLACSLVYGPHYHQEKIYKRWYYDGKKRLDVRYTTRFHLALKTDGYINPDEPICKLYVRVRQVPVVNNVAAASKVNHIFKGPIILNAADFPPDGKFKDFYIVDKNGNNWYRYPKECRDINSRDLSDPSGTYSIDNYGDQGVEFCLDWLRSDNKCTLYVDYIEVYDNDGWNEYLKDPKYVEGLITNYVKKYSNWPNLKYWLGHDEPSSLDAYIPIKTVNAIVKNAYKDAPPLITNFFPYWEIKVNNDTQLVRYYNTVEPEKLFIDFFPFTPGWTTVRDEDWECLRQILQICSSLQPGFYYQAQAFGYWQKDHWVTYRRPSANELKAQIILTLAHGVHGITFFSFDSYNAGSFILEGIIDININHTDLSKLLRYDIVPRLKGKLGKTLMKLAYTGKFINMNYQQLASSETVDYLTINNFDKNYFWHVGFFNQKDFSDNKYFLLTNLRTTKPSSTKMTVRNDTEFNNISFTNVEESTGSIDTTIAYNSSIIHTENMPPGEGRLYRVSPVVKYGGRLLYSEKTHDGMELTDDLIIENGAELIIQGDYYANANIIVNNGNVLYSKNGKIHFAPDKKLIVKNIRK